jgi:hypothetical protein
MHIVWPVVFLDHQRARFFLLYSFGVLGVGSVVYLPLNRFPPFLVTMPIGVAAGAMLPAVVAPADAPPDAVSIISCALI